MNLKEVSFLATKEYKIAFWKNKIARKLFFLLDNIALRLYNIDVKEIKSFIENWKISYKPLFIVSVPSHLNAEDNIFQKKG